MGPKLPAGVFYGKITNHRLVRGIRLTECLYSRGFEIPRHSHESPYFGFVLEGGYAETFGTRQRDCVPSTLLYHPPDELHAERHEDVVVRILNIEWPLELNERAGISPNQTSHCVKSLWQWATAIRAILRRPSGTRRASPRPSFEKDAKGANCTQDANREQESGNCSRLD